ncbi:DUF6944 family repetitive protein [Shouchella rhizosphaerae]|uniref:DUF6944 family repetitive protein n=1 Tax=Shouchella rhizosphaerae TaxID=866786 RepID=UPI003F8156C4
MESSLKEILGSLLSVIGTIQAAIGSTPQLPLNQEQSYQFRLIGNALQAVGSGLSADGQGSVSLEKIGDQIQAIGNSTVLTGMIIFSMSDHDTEERLIIAGLWMQALGSFVGLTDEFFDSTEDGRGENIIGGLLQGIGNSLQAISGIETLRNDSQRQTGVVGSWIQAVGTVVSLIGQIKEEREEIRQNINE